MSARAPAGAAAEAEAPETAGILEDLGTWLATVELDQVPAPVTATAKRGILDLLGVTLAAVDTPVAGLLRSYLDAERASGPASLIGLGRGAAVETAAFANATLGHALDYDDVSHTLGGHPSVPLVAPALALAETRGASGARLLLAYATGVEVETQIGRAVNFTHYDKGWHPTATLGTFGSAAASSYVLGLDGARATTALSLATSFAAGLKAGFGTSAKPLQVGRAAQSGATAALLAASGATANPGAFEAPQGFGMVFNGAGSFDPAAALAHLARPWDLEEPGLALKRHPCCGGTHAAVDAALRVRGQLGPDAAEEIASVDVFIHPARFAHLDRPEVGSDPLEAKFSLQYATALALLHGQVELGHFTAEALADPRLTRVREAVHGHPLPPDRQGPERFAAEVHVTTRDGRQISERLERPIGRTPETALSDADVEAKFRSCSDGVLTRPEQDEVAEIVWTLERQPFVRRLGELLRGGADRRGATA